MNTVTFSPAKDYTTEGNGLFEQIAEQCTELTRAFLKLCQTVYEAKSNSTSKEWKKGREGLEWATSTGTAYAKVGEWFCRVPIENLELLDINTIKSLCNKKYQSIVEDLEGSRLTVADVRESMTAINQELASRKEPPKEMKWSGKSDNRTLNVRIEDEQTATKLEEEHKRSQLPLIEFLKHLLDGDKAVQPQSVPVVVAVETPVVDLAPVVADEVQVQAIVVEEELLKMAEKTETKPTPDQVQISVVEKVVNEEGKWEPEMKVMIVDGLHKGKTATLDEFNERRGMWLVYLDNDEISIRVQFKPEQLELVRAIAA